MTPEEFKSKFKVGDKITAEDEGDDWWEEILFIGETCFLSSFLGEGSERKWEFDDKAWLPYEERKPEPQKTMLVSPSITDLEGLFGLTDGLHKSHAEAEFCCGQTLVKWPAQVVLKNVKELPKVPGEYVWGELPNFSADLYFEVPVNEKFGS